MYIHVQVIPSRLPDGQVVFLLPSHYVQLTSPERIKQECVNSADQDMPLDFSVKRETPSPTKNVLTSEDSPSKEDDVWRPW